MSKNDLINSSKNKFTLFFARKFRVQVFKNNLASWFAKIVPRIKLIDIKYYIVEICKKHYKLKKFMETMPLLNIIYPMLG